MTRVFHVFVGALAVLRHPVDGKVNVVRTICLFFRGPCQGERAQPQEPSDEEVAQVWVEVNIISVPVRRPCASL